MPTHPTHMREALRHGAARLADHACPGADAMRDAELLLAHAIRGTKENIAAAPERPLSPLQLFRYRRLVARRRAHTPMAYLTGWAWFHGRRFKVRRGTLIPRPATETIVSAALAATPTSTTFIDVGTGTGCVAVTCALARPNARIFATDRSRRALRVARRNAALHAATNVVCVRDDLIKRARGRVRSRDPVTIIANLPYLPDAARANLAPDVLDHEPALALFGGADGLDPSRALIDQIASWSSRPPAEIFFELLPGQIAPLSAYATTKIPGLAAEPLLNAAETPIGARFTVR